MVLITATEKTRTEGGCCKESDLLVLKNEKTREFGTQKVCECCKQSLQGHDSRNLEDGSARSNAVCRGLAQEVSEGNNVNNWARGHSGNILANNLVALCYCPENLPKAKFKSNKIKAEKIVQ